MRAGGEEAVCTVTVWKPGRSEGGDSGKNRPSGAGEAGWFRFDAAGRLLTDWRWIPDASGREYCYYFHPNAGGPMGAMAASGKTPDGYEVDAQGRWCADGTPQTR